MSENGRRKFTYSYSAREQAEIRKIRQKYTNDSEACRADKLEELRRLDGKATEKATVISLVAGILSAVVFGIGMCCVLVWDGFFVLGIFFGILGIFGMFCAYPLYSKTTEAERRKIAPRIIELTDELSL